MALTTAPDFADGILPAAKLQQLSDAINQRTPLYAAVTVDQALATSDTSLENVTELVVAVPANVTYIFELCLAFNLSAGSTEDIKVGMSFPAGATCDFGGAGPASTVTASNGDGEFLRRLAATSGTTANGYGGVTNVLNAIITIRLATSSTAGNLQIMASQNTSGGNTTTVQAGSYLIGWRVS